jgi:hypothetical protein
MPTLQTAGAEQYILLPARSLRGDSRLVSNTARTFLHSLSTELRTASSASPGAMQAVESQSVGNLPVGAVRILDSISEEGAKLVVLTPAARAQLQTQQPGLRVVPVQYYTPALAPRPAVRIATAALAQATVAAPSITFRVVDALTGTGIPNATVVAFTNFAARAGAQGTTDNMGAISLSLGGANPAFERLYIYPKSGYWPALKQNGTLSTDITVKLTPIDLTFQDALRFFYGAVSAGDGAGVTVGVVDTGIATHPDLTIADGFNAVPGEDPNDFGDNGEGHGTHVAGIIAAHGTPPTGIQGIAPGVTLRSYRVFGAGAGGASNYAIIKAIDQAIQDGCDLLNLSLGGGPSDPALETAIKDARQSGCLVICAAGNDNRSQVSSPGSDPLALAVSALGREGTYPDGAEEFGNIQRPPNGADASDYIAAFSNVGPQLSFTAPGDGIISTFPGGYAVLDGTSMACPAATGRAACLLAGDTTLLNMPRDVNRSDAVAAKLLQAAIARGFGHDFEGNGLLP